MRLNFMQRKKKEIPVINYKSKWRKARKIRFRGVFEQIDCAKARFSLDCFEIIYFYV